MGAPDPRVTARLHRLISATTRTRLACVSSAEISSLPADPQTRRPLVLLEKRVFICYDRILAALTSSIPAAPQRSPSPTSLPERREKNRLDTRNRRSHHQEHQPNQPLTKQYPAPSATVLREAGRPLRERAGRESLGMTHRRVFIIASECTGIAIVHIDDTVAT
jgi:hypothetical protein